MDPDTEDLSDLFSRWYQTSISPDRVLTSMMVWPKKSSLSLVSFCLSLAFRSLSSSQTLTLILSLELWHSNENFSFHSGLSSWGTVFVRFFVFPTCTVTYGSLVPVLSLAMRPWAHTTETHKHYWKLSTTTFQQKYLEQWNNKWMNYEPVTWILQDHLEVPSRTTCSEDSRLDPCVLGSTLNTVLKVTNLLTTLITTSICSQIISHHYSS